MKICFCQLGGKNLSFVGGFYQGWQNLPNPGIIQRDCAIPFAHI